MSHTIRCAKCTETHTSAAAVRACFEDRLFSCHWMVQRNVVVGGCEEYGVETELQIVDCGAEAIGTERGWTCADGHEHVTIDARVAEGWEYAEDFGEAMNLARAGVEPLTMSGHVVLGERSFEKGA